MNAPGEQLLIKLWETIADKGIGSLLKPWQKQREGKAEIAVKRQELLMLAQAEADVTAIRSGQMKLLPDGTLSEIKTLSVEDNLLLPNMAKVANQNILTDAIRKEINLSKTIVYAENELIDDSQAPSAEQVTDDWLFRWKEFASKVSEDEIQQLWAKVLAGEVKHPGTTSYRLLDFIDKLNKREIEDISKIFSFVMVNNNLILRGVENDTGYLVNNNLDKQFFQKMSDLGIISQATAGVINIKTELDFSKFDPYHFGYNGFVLCVKQTDKIKDNKLSVLYYSLSTLGLELFAMAKIPSDQKYLESLADDFTSAGAISSLHIPDA